MPSPWKRAMTEQELRTDVELLKKDVSNIQGLLGKLDTAIDKIADASGGISKILAVHDQNIDVLQSDVEERKRLSEKETELLHRRISEMKDEVIAKLDKMDTDVGDKLETLSTRVTVLERWKWWVMGGSWAIGFFIATLLQIGGFLTKLF